MSFEVNKNPSTTKLISSFISDKEFIKNIINIRRHLHKNPELSESEYNTQKYIRNCLTEIGIKDVKKIAETGIVAQIFGTRDNPKKDIKSILLRADIDALPICESNNVPYKSQNAGIMHACGHDVHTAVMLGVCYVLNSIKDNFSGCVKILFQPKEETTGGAMPSINEGILNNPKVSRALALHVDPDIECGKIRIKEGSLYASPDDFKIRVIGRGGHGAQPDKCIDPIMISANIINAINSFVAREVNPFDNAVVTVASIHGGTATNIIPDEVQMTGTARSLTNETRDLLERRIGEISKGISESYGAKAEYVYTRLFPPLINDKNVCKELISSSKNAIGDENCIVGGEATMAGEDFAYFSQHVPSALFKLGCKNQDKGIIYPIHHSSFDVDEDCIKTGISVFANYVVDYFNN